MGTAVLNGVLGFVMLITFCFCIQDLDAALSAPTGFPFIYIFYNATQSYAGTSIMACILIFMYTFGVIGTVATCSRQIFAFARDKGLPFSGFLCYVRLSLLSISRYISKLTSPGQTRQGHSSQRHSPVYCHYHLTFSHQYRLHGCI